MIQSWLHIRRASVFVMLFFSFNLFGQGYEFIFESPRYWVPEQVFDTVPFTVQIRSSNETCVTLQSDWEKIDTTFKMARNSLVNYELPTGQGDLVGTVTLNGASDKLVYIRSTQPVAVTLYVGIEQEVSSIKLQKSDSCLERQSAEATDFLPTHLWGTEYCSNLPMRLVDSFYYNQRVFFHAGGIYRPNLISKPANSIYLKSKDSANYASFQVNSNAICSKSGVNLGQLLHDTIVLQHQAHNLYFHEDGRKFFYDSTLVRFRFYFKSLVDRKFSVMDHWIEGAIDSVGLYKIFEQARPKSFSGNEYAIPAIPGYDSLLASVVFHDSTNTITINNQIFGPISRDSLFRFFYQENTLLESASDFQVSVATMPGPNWPVGNLPVPTYSNTYHGTGFHALGPAHFIERTLFQPLAASDGATEPNIVLVTPASGVDSLVINGHKIPPGQFTPFNTSPGYFSYHQVLHRDSIYLVENPAGFMPVLYTLPKDTSGYVGLYSLLLTETPKLDLQERDGLRWGLHDTIFSDENKLTVCEGNVSLSLFLPEARFTTWYYEMVDGSLFRQKVGAEEPDTLQFNLNLAQGNYEIVVRDSAGCLSSDTLLITVVPLKARLIDVQFAESCEGLQLIASAFSEGATQKEWLINGVRAGTGDVLQYAIQENDFPLKLSFSAANEACDTLIHSTFEDQPDSLKVQLPNVFTPNGDGLNDCFFIDKNLRLYQNCYSLSIYNRWGKLVWFSNDQADCWAGNVQSEQAAPGTYFYVLKLGHNEYSGHLSLIR